MIKKLLPFAVLPLLLLAPATASALRYPFYLHHVPYWWVESGTGCGAAAGQQPQWLFTTSTEAVRFYSGGTTANSISYWHHNYTVPSTNVDAWRITLDTNICPTVSPERGWNNWFWRNCDGTTCSWADNMDYEGFMQVTWDSLNQAYVCRYFGEAKTSMCNRTMSNPNVYTNWGKSAEYGWNYGPDRWQVSDDIYYAPPQL